MKLHLVGGFLGSGKTTAIGGAARELVRRGQSVGVITNDQSYGSPVPHRSSGSQSVLPLHRDARALK